MSRSALRHPVVGAIAVFLVVAAVLLAATGAYLALDPSIGGASAAAWSRGMNLTGTSTFALELIRAADGAWFNLKTPYPGIPISPPGTPIGKVDFTIGKAERGWPQPTTIIWNVTLNQVHPAPGAPDAADELAWRAMIAEALGHSFPGRFDFPATIRTGSAHAVTRHPWAFVLNMGERLWYSPRWWMGCVAGAGLIGLLAGVLLHRNPRRAPGACRGCGYDLRGLSGGVCPECGAPAV